MRSRSVTMPHTDPALIGAVATTTQCIRRSAMSFATLVSLVSGETVMTPKCIALDTFIVVHVAGCEAIVAMHRTMPRRQTRFVTPLPLGSCGELRRRRAWHVRLISVWRAAAKRSRCREPAEDVAGVVTRSEVERASAKRQESVVVPNVGPIAGANSYWIPNERGHR